MIRVGSFLLLFAAAAVPLRGQTASRADSGAAMPLGMGTLKQDMVSLRFSVNALDIRFMPLEEPFLRLLSPDAYQALSALLASQRLRIDSIASARGIQQPGIAMVSFFSATPNTRFDPRQLALILPSRRIQPIGVISLSPSFANQQIMAREQAQGLVVFERSIPVTETFAVSYLTTVNRDWESGIFPRLVAERTRILGVKRDSLEVRP